MKRIALAAAGSLLMVTLAGCHTADHKSITQTAQAASGFMESAVATDMELNLMIEPLKVGENHFIVTMNAPDITAVEAQIVMATMGHGEVVDLVRTAPGRWESTNHAIEMSGRWMIRVKSTLTSGEEKTATFHLVVK